MVFGFALPFYIDQSGTAVSSRRDLRFLKRFRRFGFGRVPAIGDGLIGQPASRFGVICEAESSFNRECILDKN